MKSIKIAIMIALFVVIQITGLEKASTFQTDPELIQIQNTLEDLGREHLAAQKHLGATASTTFQDKITELTNQLKNVLTPEQRAKIKAQIEQLKLNIQKYIKPTAPAA